MIREKDEKVEMKRKRWKVRTHVCVSFKPYSGWSPEMLYCVKCRRIKNWEVVWPLVDVSKDQR